MRALLEIRANNKDSSGALRELNRAQIEWDALAWDDLLKHFTTTVRTHTSWRIRVLRVSSGMVPGYLQVRKNSSFGLFVNRGRDLMTSRVTRRVHLEDVLWNYTHELVNP